MSKKTQALIETLEKKFPESKPTTTRDFNGVEGGIWFRGSEDVLANGERVFDYYNEAWDFSINPRIDKVLAKAGYFAEPYDSGTCMAYEI